MVLEGNWRKTLIDIEYRFYVTDEEFYETIYPEDVDFLLNLIAKLKEKAFGK